MREDVSAVITTFNYARYIGLAIESILRQTVPPTEIVVVDDGSTDETAAVVAPYLSKGLRYVRQERRGAGAARNRGLAETRCDLVAFLDADDQWLPDKLACQLEHLRRFPRAGLVTCSEWEVYESSVQRPRIVRRRFAGAARVYPRLLVENFVGNPSAVLVRRDCFRAAGNFDESLPLGQDWDMWIRIARLFPIGTVDRPLFLFTKHSGSLTTGQTAARYRSNREIFRRYMNDVSPLMRSLLWREARSMNDFYAAASIVNVPKQRRHALRLAFRAAWLDPAYKWQLKAPLLLHATIGHRAFTGLSRLVHKYWRG